MLHRNLCASDGTLGTVFGLFIMHDMSDLRAWDDRGDKLRERDMLWLLCVMSVYLACMG